jgi:EAL domain-containing protein (putative c-di-GMP-specific phosphodiesterase class I)
MAAALPIAWPETSSSPGLSRKLDRALENAWIAFQPIVDEPARKVLGYEALLRSKDESLPHPGAILDAAERVDRIHDVGARVRELAVRAFEGAEAGALLFLNLHPADLVDPRLHDPGAPLSRIAERVVLELTERSSIHDVEDLAEHVASLRALGFRMAVDDLGAGYAGLSTFAAFEPEIAKLDMSLVRGVDKSPVRQRVVASMLALCRDLGSHVVAEGVETADERAALAAIGCEWMQGYLFGRPAAGFAPASF